MAGEFLRSFANVLLQLGSERSGLIFGQRFLREESVSVSEKRNYSPTLLVNLRWSPLSENFLLIRKDPSAISEKRQPLEKNFLFKLEICYEERLEILQEEICNFEESFLLLEPSQTLRYFLQRYEKNFSNILNLVVLFQTLEPSRIATRALKIQRRKFHRRKATRLRRVSSKHRYSPWKNRPAFNYLVDPVCSTTCCARFAQTAAAISARNSPPHFVPLFRSREVYPSFDSTRNSSAYDLGIEANAFSFAGIITFETVRSVR